MEHTITLTHKEYTELAALPLEIEKLKKELEQEKEKKNGYVFLRTSLTHWNPYEGRAMRVGVIDYSIQTAPIVSVDKLIVTKIFEECLFNLINEGIPNYILTRERVKLALDSIDLQRTLQQREVERLWKKEKEIEEKLAKIPKLLKWFL